MTGVDKPFHRKSQIANVLVLYVHWSAQGCRSIIPQIGWLKQQVSFLTALETGSLRSGCHADGSGEHPLSGL